MANVWGASVSIADTITYSDSTAAQFNFVGANNETITYTDASTSIWNASAYLNEIVYTQDFVTPQIIYMGSMLESVILTDIQVLTGWYRINNNENTIWVQINNNQ